MIALSLVTADHQHMTDAGEVLPCGLPYARCQGRPTDVYVIVIEDPADWQDWQ